MIIANVMWIVYFVTRENNYWWYDSNGENVWWLYMMLVFCFLSDIAFIKTKNFKYVLCCKSYLSDDDEHYKEHDGVVTTTYTAYQQPAGAVVTQYSPGTSPGVVTQYPPGTYTMPG